MKKYISALGLFAVLFVLGGCTIGQEVMYPGQDDDFSYSPVAYDVENYKIDEPGRQISDDCKWELVGGHGFEVMSQKCPNYWVESESNSFVEKTVTGYEFDVIKKFSKEKEMSPEDFIKTTFIDRLDLSAKLGCEVVAYGEKINKWGEEITRYTIEPVGEYKKEFMGKMKIDPTYLACGEYGTTNGVQYFEYHSAQPHTMLFVLIGQEYPIFDENSIRPVFQKLD